MPPAVQAVALQSLHACLRASVYIMGIGLASPRTDTVAEDTSAAAGAAGKDVGDVRCVRAEIGGVGAAEGIVGSGCLACSVPDGNSMNSMALLGHTGVPSPCCRRFLNRLLGLPVAQQNLLFNYFQVLCVSVDVCLWFVCANTFQCHLTLRNCTCP